MTKRRRMMRKMSRRKVRERIEERAVRRSHAGKSAAGVEIDEGEGKRVAFPCQVSCPATRWRMERVLGDPIHRLMPWDMDLRETMVTPVVP